MGGWVGYLEYTDVFALCGGEEASNHVCEVELTVFWCGETKRVGGWVGRWVVGR